MKVFVIGGSKKLVYGSFRNNLRLHGVTISGHADQREEKYRGLPVLIDGVIVLTDLIDHPTVERVDQDLAKRGLLLRCYTTSKWSEAKDKLIKDGFIRTQSSTQQAIQQPVVDINHKYDWMTDDVNAVAGAISMSSDNIGLTKQEAREVVQHYLNSDFNLVKDPQLLVSKVVNDFPGVAEFVDLEMATSVVSSLRQMWRRDYDTVQNTKFNWLVSEFSKYNGEPNTWPSVHSLSDNAQRIFGSIVKGDQVAVARSKAIGPWAESLDRPTPSYNEYKRLVPDTSLTFQELTSLLDSGKVKSVRTVKGQFTSVAAISEYVESRKAEKKATKALQEAIGKPVQALSPQVAPVAQVVVPVIEAALANQPLDLASDNFCATPILNESTSEPVAQPTFDAIELASLIDHGVGVRVKDVVTHLDGLKSGVDAMQGFQREVLLALADASAAIENLRAVVSTLSAEVAALKSSGGGRVSIAESIGSSILNAGGAEVKLTFGAGFK